MTDLERQTTQTVPDKPPMGYALMLDTKMKSEDQVKNPTAKSNLNIKAMNDIDK